MSCWAITILITWKNSPAPASGGMEIIHLGGGARPQHRDVPGRGVCANMVCWCSEDPPGWSLAFLDGDVGKPNMFLLTETTSCGGDGEGGTKKNQLEVALSWAKRLYLGTK